MAKKDLWIPACGGTEPVFSVGGRRWQYCWNQATSQHRYLDVDADRIVSNPQFHPTHAPEFEYVDEMPATQQVRHVQSDLYYF